MKKDGFFYPIIFMALLTGVFTFILASLNYTTADRIEFLEESQLKEKILYIFDIDISGKNPEEIGIIFMENVKEEEYLGKRLFYIEEGGQVLKYAVPVSGKGVWGMIEAYIGISGDLSKIIGLEFISHSETPGLGGRISEAEYRKQFRDIDISNRDNDLLTYRPSPKGNIDALAGATGTSRAVIRFLNEDLNSFILEKEGR